MPAPPEDPPREPPPPPVEREMPTRWAYTCAAASSQALPSASEPRRFAGSIVVATSNTVSARWGPRPHVLERWAFALEILNPPGILPPMARDTRPVEYFPRLPE